MLWKSLFTYADSQICAFIFRRKQKNLYDSIARLILFSYWKNQIISFMVFPLDATILGNAAFKNSKTSKMIHNDVPVNAPIGMPPQHRFKKHDITVIPLNT